MKFKDWTMVFVLTLIIISNYFYNSLALQNQRQIIVLQSDVASVQQDIASIESQIQTIQDSYVSYDDIQPLVEMFDEYQEEVDQIRNNLNDFNELWNQLFGYEQEQYVMRGR